MTLPIIEKLTPFTSKFLSKFTSEVENDGEMYIEEIQTMRPKLTKWEIFILILLMYSIIVSITLNTNVELRKFLGFDGSAGIISTIFSIILVILFGPVLYLLALLTKFFESFGSYLISSNVNVIKSWVDGLAYISKNQKGIIAQLMTPFTWF
jgi:hypothetical protein